MQVRWQLKNARIVALGWAALVAALAIDHASAQRPGSEPKRAEIRVGLEEGDLRGSDNRTLQAALDHVAALGGGTVHILPGRYSMRNALILRSNVAVVGTPGETVLAACDGLKTALAVDGDCNESQITLADPSGFRVGDGVAIQDDHYSGGFEVTTATLTAQLDANTFQISAPLYLDYMVHHKASARLAFPVVGGWEVRNVVLDGLTIEGNRDRSERLDGCRGGGIYLFKSEGVTIRRCAVRSYNGDGISFQVSHRVTLEDCLAENNAGLGLHPGSGSQQPVLRRNRSIANGQDGIYVCWRVKHGLFEHNELRANQGVGISIGHKDTDNLFRDNKIIGNARAGVLFRDEAEPMGAHRNVFERNVILDNGASSGGSAAGAAIVVRGHHHDLIFRDNTIGHSSTSAAAGVGIIASKHAQSLKADDNEFVQVERTIEVEE